MSDEVVAEGADRAEGDAPSGAAVATEAARALLAKHGVSSADDIHVARIAAGEGAYVVYRPTGSGDARTVRAGSGRAWLCIDERARGTPRARWSMAHELAHVLLHPDADAIARIHGGGPKTGRDFQIEREADAFSRELLMPEHLFAERCGAARALVGEIDALGREFGTSRTATGRRYTEFAASGCALVECKGGRVVRAARSKGFRGTAVERRVVEETTMAAGVGRGERVAGAGLVEGGGWGSGKVGVAMMEACALVPESGVVVVWLVHEGVGAGRGRRGR